VNSRDLSPEQYLHCLDVSSLRLSIHDVSAPPSSLPIDPLLLCSLFTTINQKSALSQQRIRLQRFPSSSLFLDSLLFMVTINHLDQKPPPLNSGPERGHHKRVRWLRPTTLKQKFPLPQQRTRGGSSQTRSSTSLRRSPKPRAPSSWSVHPFSRSTTRRFGTCSPRTQTTSWN
jgi:hypothetical protein